MRARRSRGAAAVMIAVTVPTIIIIVTGMMMIGKILMTRQRLQYAADAVAANGALTAKRMGLASASVPNSQVDYSWLPSLATTQAVFNRARDGNFVIGGNQAMPTWSFENANNSSWARSQVTLTTSAAGYTLTAQAAMRVQQLMTNSPRRRPPTLMLVLDYSNSMNRRSNAFGVAIAQLRSVVSTFLDGLPQDSIRVGAITYGSNVYDVVAPATRRDSSDFVGIRSVLNRAAGGDTATGPAVDAAVATMLAQPENFGRNIMVVSDGEPCCSNGADTAALVAAANARANQVQVITIEVHHVASGGQMHQLLLQMSGDASLHFEAENTADLIAQFQGVRARPLCDIVVPGDPNDAYVYLYGAGGNERPLQRFEDPAAMSCPDHCDVYGYRVESPRVILSPIACEQVYSNLRQALVRWGPTQMAM